MIFIYSRFYLSIINGTSYGHICDRKFADIMFHLRDVMSHSFGLLLGTTVMLRDVRANLFHRNCREHIYNIIYIITRLDLTTNDGYIHQGSSVSQLALRSFDANCY